jgi:DNA-binding NarL/FixJ family response regulator
VLTSREDRSELATAARAGEATFVSREVTGAELAELIRAVGHGGRPAGPILAEPLGSVGPEQHEDELRWLTFQERRILSGIGEGLTNREISERMFLAEKTVKNYASNLLVKLGMRHRAQAAALFARLDERHHLAH